MNDATRNVTVKMVQFYVEKLGETLCQLGIDTDKFGIRYQGKIATRSKNHQRKRNPPPQPFAIKKCNKIGSRKYKCVNELYFFWPSIDRSDLWWQDIIVDFQQHVLYAFLISVLQGMAVTSEEELERLHEASARGDRLMDTTDDDDASVVSDVPNGKTANAGNAAASAAGAGAGTPGTRDE